MEICSKQCLVSCKEQIFTFERKYSLHYCSNSTFNFFENYYTFMNYAPNMLFVQYIIKVANLINLWHGIDFALIRDKLFELIALFLTNTKISWLFDALSQLLMSSVNTRVFVAFWIKAFRLIVGNSKV